MSSSLSVVIIVNVCLSIALSKAIIWCKVDRTNMKAYDGNGKLHFFHSLTHSLHFISTFGLELSYCISFSEVSLKILGILFI